jgi:hypothetical protein
MMDSASTTCSSASTSFITTEIMNIAAFDEKTQVAMSGTAERTNFPKTKILIVPLKDHTLRLF